MTAEREGWDPERKPTEREIGEVESISNQGDAPRNAGLGAEPGGSEGVAVPDGS